MKKHFRNVKQSMQGRLLLYMLLLALLLLLGLFAGTFLLRRFDKAGNHFQESLGLQLGVFEKDVTDYFDSLAADSLVLAERLGEYLDAQLAMTGKDFAGLNGDEASIRELQSFWIERMQQRLLRQNCSGIFFVLDLTYNTAAEEAAHSRSGVYLQQNRFQPTVNQTWLYRGISDIGKEQEVMPHRKWRMEFHTDDFPGYEKFVGYAGRPAYTAYGLTRMFSLPGTSDEVMLLVSPITGRSGDFYGLCGYEVSADFFAADHVQPSTLTDPICLLTAYEEEGVDPATGLICHGAGSNYVFVEEALRFVGTNRGLLFLKGENSEYVGLSKQVKLSPTNEEYRLTVMIPQRQYQRMAMLDRVQNLLLIGILLLFALFCCIYFSNRYLRPLLQGLEQVKSKNWQESPSPIAEIKDLFQFLADYDESSRSALNELMQERMEAQARLAQTGREHDALAQQYEKAREELAQAKAALELRELFGGDEAAAAAYSTFLRKLSTLSPTEQTVFNYYLEGRGVKEIAGLMGIQESTMRYHNRNIYSKLEVRSLKELLHYISLMKRSRGDPGTD